MFRVQSFRELMPPWRSATSGRCRSGGPPWWERGRLAWCRSSGSGELGAHALCEGGHLPVELGPIGGEKLEDEVLDSAVGELRDLLDETRRLSREHAAAVSRCRRSLAGPHDADVVAKRERRRHGAATRLAESRQLGPAGPQLLRRTVDRMPGGAELGGATKRGPAVPPDPDRRVRLLDRLGLELEAAELRVFSPKSTS